MSIEIITCEQGTPEWFAARLGIPTASCFDDVMANGKGGAPSKTRTTYMYKLAGERITGDPMDNYTSAHMERGKVMEDEARALYAFMTGNDPARVGFIRNGAVGCSPDSLVGDDGLLEIKTKLAHLQIDALLSGSLPAEHVKQVQGQLWVSGRKWCDFFSYWPKMPALLVRVQRDEEMIQSIATAVWKFNVELDALTDRLKNWKA